MVKYAVLDTVLLYIIIVSANTMVSLLHTIVNSSIYNTHLELKHMKFTIQLTIAKVLTRGHGFLKSCFLKILNGAERGCTIVAD